MAIPVIPLPLDRLTAQRAVTRTEQRPVDRENFAVERPAGQEADPLELSQRPERSSATIAKLGDHLAHHRPNHRTAAESGRPPQPSIDPRQGQVQAPPSPSQVDAVQRIAQLVGRTAGIAFQAQLIAHGTAGPASQSQPAQANQRLAETASAAYRRRQGIQDTAPLIDPHRPIDIVL